MILANSPGLIAERLCQGQMIDAEQSQNIAQSRHQLSAG
jgi:hypothetical protein